MVLPKSSSELRQAIGLVFDAFDHEDTLNLVLQRSGRIVSMSRLLPTTGPYPLQASWPELAVQMHAPKSSGIWELSRLQGVDEFAVLALLHEMEGWARGLGIKRLVVEASVTLERLFNQAGLHAHRAGASWIRRGQSMCVCWIEVR